MSRRLPLIFVAVLTLIGVVVAGVAIAVSGVGGSPVAYTVNGTKVSQKTIDHELKWLASTSQVKKGLEQQGGTATDASISSAFTATWLNQRIQADLLRQTAAKKGVTVPAPTRSALEKQIAKRYPNAPESARQVLFDQNAYLSALGATTQQQQSDLLTAALKRAEITVDPRYGRWNPRQGVCPPTGCAPTSAG
jgi:SurA N-terminal domain